MDGSAILVIVVLVVLGLIIKHAVQSSREEKPPVSSPPTTTVKPAPYTPPSTLRGDLARPYYPPQPAYTAAPGYPVLTKTQQYAMNNHMWICPHCETLVNQNYHRCFICYCPRR